MSSSLASSELSAVCPTTDHFLFLEILAALVSATPHSPGFPPTLLVVSSSQSHLLVSPFKCKMSEYPRDRFFHFFFFLPTVISWVISIQYHGFMYRLSSDYLQPYITNPFVVPSLQKMAAINFSHPCRHITLYQKLESVSPPPAYVLAL